ncbi:MAG: hypothetical protein ACW99U_17800, partial [Candidatus Thorarchaeota archaeon]|jgi:hypothetical protein
MTLPWSLKKRLEVGLPRYVAMATDTLLPQTTETAIFTVAGGPILVHGLVMKIGTVVQTQATVSRWINNPTTGTTMAMCADLDLTAAASGAYYSIVDRISALTLANCWCSPPIIANIGAIALDTDGSSTGSFTAELWWSPLITAGAGQPSGGNAVSAI